MPPPPPRAGGRDYNRSDEAPLPPPPVQATFTPTPAQEYNPFAADGTKKGKKNKGGQGKIQDPKPADLAAAMEEEMTSEDAEQAAERAMMEMMGIPCGFDSTKVCWKEPPYTGRSLPPMPCRQSFFIGNLFISCIVQCQPRSVHEYARRARRSATRTAS